MFALVGIVALVCNFTGILLLVRQGVPHRLLGDSLALAHEPEQGALGGNDRRRMLSFAGLVLLTLGTAMQMATIVFRSA